jgi:DNA-(apurinic or apyrimidinic site) lyase
MGFAKVNETRVQSLATIVSVLGREKVLLFEDIDPQYKAIKRVAEVCKSYTSMLVVLNALVSYRLTMTGEEYWTAFSDYVAKHCIGIDSAPSAEYILKIFIEKFNRALLSKKLFRVSKAVRCRGVLEAIEKRSLTNTWRELSLCLSANPSSKTIVFAVKMLYYAKKALGERVEVPMEIPIPVDGRVALVTYLSGALIVEGVSTSREALLRYSDTIRNVWSKVARLSGVPPLNLDAMIWYFGKYAYMGSRSKVLEKAFSELKNLFSRDEVEMLVDNLFYLVP